MKLSELVGQLQAILEIEGDIQARVFVYRHQYPIEKLTVKKQSRIVMADGVELPELKYLLIE